MGVGWVRNRGLGRGELHMEVTQISLLSFSVTTQTWKCLVISLCPCSDDAPTFDPGFNFVSKGDSLIDFTGR
jgi:hypothetical protein